jgi:hypothetical protein
MEYRTEVKSYPCPEYGYTRIVWYCWGPNGKVCAHGGQSYGQASFRLSARAARLKVEQAAQRHWEKFHW